MSATKIGPSWWADFSYRGVRHRIRSPENSRAGAIAYEAVLRRRMSDGESPPASSAATTRQQQTYATFAENWFATYVRANNKPAEQLRKRYLLSAHLIPFLGQTELAEITAADVERYKASKREAGLSPKTINNHLSVLSKSLTTAQEWDLIKSVPRTRFMRVPPQVFDFLSPDESNALLRAAGEESLSHEMILCALRTGLRAGELLGLEWRDVDFERGHLRVVRTVSMGEVGSPKNNRTRVVPLSRDLRAVLANRRESVGRVFRLKAGRLSYKTATNGLWRACARAGLRRVSWHALRHSFASQLVAAGAPMRAVQELLGHSTIQMTMRYSHLSPSLFHDVVEVLPTLGTTQRFDAAVTSGLRAVNAGATPRQPTANAPLVVAAVMGVGI